ncbi:ABC transporter ATP-binding protein [Periweissella fabaria]|uniref:Oligopeptide transport ATP-binding protein OppD n=1 Tax=Periweissella fabaria TaxID=546157 RepID=A0ABM8Z5Q3_9LACO|nr:ABC transporter ATP-binding protein [Periweissella fabaria]MCM0597536.1 ABC transporter ATP-binding protein [Periweissella fabaria]CAH0416719.1 Oligopeptide transport ATP-binding protein OppD [Periweissella fabaria]
MKEETLLSINGVSVAFKINGEFYTAIDDVSLELHRDEVLAIVGESGSGKSTLATTVIGLHNMNATKITGEINFQNKEILELSEDEFNDIRGDEMGMIFQDPLAALNPLIRIGDQIKESLDVHSDMTEDQKQARVHELLNQVGIPHPERVAKQFPHQLSGGMRQRIIIAIAIANKPQLIIADEPTTALDVTIQAQILDLLKDIQRENHAGIILITHDLGVVAEVADTVAVMYAGEIVEQAPVATLFNDAKHPYTRSLLRAMPTIDSEDDELYVVEGAVPSIKDMDRNSDLFAPRIPWTKPDVGHPVLKEIAPNHYVRGESWREFKFKDEL